MARERLSRLQYHLLTWLLAEDMRLRGQPSPQHPGSSALLVKTT